VLEPHPMQPFSPQRSAVIAVMGVPNAGKSTLVNRMVGRKVSIVSPKVQTTRFRVCGVLTEGDTQLVLVDTPGIFTPKGVLDKAMVSAAWDGVAGADGVWLLVDATKRNHEASQGIAEKLHAQGLKLTLVVTKVDAVPKPRLLELVTRLHAQVPFPETFMVSARTGDGVADLIAHGKRLALSAPWLYPEDQLCDLQERMFASEMTREKLFLALQQELPYALTVETESWDDKGEKGITIHQTIYVERPSQKGIVLGKDGAMLKSIGSAARRDLTRYMERPVHLFLHVKIDAEWKQHRARLAYMGLA
jgi:GTP-binding protein Era